MKRNITTVAGIECAGYQGRHPTAWSDDDRLLACPFCGHMAAIKADDNKSNKHPWQVMCWNTSCGVRTPAQYATQELAIEAWNRRALAAP